MAKKKSSAQCSAAGKALAECRWGKGKTKKPARTKKPKGTKKPKAKPKAAQRKSRRLAGQAPVRGPEPNKKPRKKRKQKAAARSAASKKVEDILVPGFNPPKGDMKSFLEQQRRQWA